MPMTDFVLEQKKLICEDYKTITEVFFNRIVDYATFLKQPLTLGMFVPVDEEGDILKEPRMIHRTIGFDEQDVFWDINEVEDYRKAKEKVLFEGFELKGEASESWIFKINGVFPFVIFKTMTIESLIIYKAKFQLTPSALKTIGI